MSFLHIKVGLNQSQCFYVYQFTHSMNTPNNTAVLACTRHLCKVLTMNANGVVSVFFTKKKAHLSKAFFKTQSTVSHLLMNTANISHLKAS